MSWPTGDHQWVTVNDKNQEYMLHISLSCSYSSNLSWFQLKTKLFWSFKKLLFLATAVILDGGQGYWTQFWKGTILERFGLIWLQFQRRCSNDFSPKSEQFAYFYQNQQNREFFCKTCNIGSLSFYFLFIVIEAMFDNLN